MEFPSLENTAREAGATVLFCSNVKVSGSKQDHIVIVTDCFISQFEHEMKLEKQSYWCDLAEFQDRNERFELIFFNEKQNEDYVIFSYPKRKRQLYFYKIIFELVERIFPKDQLTSFHIPSSQQIFNVTARGAFAQFLFLNMRKKVPIPELVKENVAQYILTKQRNIKIENQACIEDFADSFLAALYPLDYVESVSFPQFENFDILYSLTGYLRKYNKIKYFEIYNPFPSSMKKRFHDFCTTIENQNQNQFERKLSSGGRQNILNGLHGISFIKTQFSEDNLASLKTAAIGGNLLSLGFIDCKFDSLENLMNIFDNQLTRGLRILTLDKTLDLDIQRLVQSCGEIDTLSLESCNLEVSVVLEAISSSKTQLRSVNLSGNQCSNHKDIQNAANRLPIGFKRIFANRVKWADDCLTDFLTGLVEREKWFETKENDGFVLSLANANCSKSEWLNVKYFFENNSHKPPISEFSWSGNPITPNLFIFLKKLKQLKKLFLNNCPSLDKYSSHLSDFVGNSPSLELLSIQNNGAIPNADKFFEVSQRSMRLRSLNLRYCNFGPSGLSCLLKFVQKCRTLSEISFDGCSCHSLKDLRQFINGCTNIVSKSPSKSKRIRRIKIELPANDLRKLKASEGDIEEIKYALADCEGVQGDLWIAPLEYSILQENELVFPRFYNSKESDDKPRDLSDSEDSSDAIIVERSPRGFKDHGYQNIYDEHDQNRQSSKKMKPNTILPKRSKYDLDSDEDNEGNEKDKTKSYLFKGKTDISDDENKEITQRSSKSHREPLHQAHLSNLTESSKRKILENDWTFPIAEIPIDNPKLLTKRQDEYSLKRYSSALVNEKD